jgi:uncharacterized protein YuzE
MKVDSFPETRTIYITLVDEATSAESRELATGVLVDYDETSRPIGIELELDLIPGFAGSQPARP